MSPCSRSSVLALTVALVGSACVPSRVPSVSPPSGGSSSSANDAGQAQGPNDTGPRDTGSVAQDSGPRDAGSAVPDAGSAVPDAGSAVPDAGGGGPQTATVFSTGHSLLEGTPAHMAAIAASQGLSMQWERQHVNGSPLRIRTKGSNPNASSWPGYREGANKNGGSIDVLAELSQRNSVSRPYDTLLVTERHDILLTLQWENTVGYLDHFIDRVQARNSNMRTIFTQVWPGIPNMSNPAPWIAVLREELMIWECTASKLNLLLAEQGRSDRVGVSPGALALAAFVEDVVAGRVPAITGSTQQRMQTIFQDGVHLRDSYRYLIAAVQYGILFGRSPVGAAGPSGLDASIVDAMQRTAWSTVQSYTQGVAANRSMAQCRTAAQAYCPTFQTMWAVSDRNFCNYWSANSPNHPFRWPDSNLVTYPAP